jgi:hypothetical protein
VLFWGAWETQPRLQTLLLSKLLRLDLSEAITGCGAAIVGVQTVSLFLEALTVEV